MDADFKSVMLERCYSDKSTMTPQRLLILDTLVELKKPISAYELKDYLNAINYTKENLLDTEDEQWEKKYYPFIVNKCVAPFPQSIN